MKVKHSKYKNTGILFELLTRQLTADTIADNQSKAFGLFPAIVSEVNCLVKSSNKIPVFLYLECFTFMLYKFEFIVYKYKPIPET